MNLQFLIINRSAFHGPSTDRKDGSQGQSGESTVAGAYPVQFRLRRLHYLYPDLVGQRHIDSWLGDPYCDFVGDYDRHREQEALIARSKNHNGRSGSSFSFGGGSSSGGGGGGGGW